ncbi:MAG: hypothetical protein ABR521_12050 [Gaiellaceae bacterium]
MPPPLEAAVLRALARQPECRQPDALELGRDLRAALEEPTFEAPTLPLVQAPRSAPPLRRPGIRLAAAAALLAALVAVALAVALAGREEPPAPREPARVAPVPDGATPAQDARNLARWLRAHAR